MKKDTIFEWLNETSQVLAIQTMDIIQECPKPVKEAGLEDKLFYAFIEELIQIKTEMALIDHTQYMKMSNEEKYNHTIEKFTAFKYNLANSLCVGIERAYANVYNQYVDYCCHISLMPDSINKEMC